MKLKNKLAVIIGGATGIGTAISRKLGIEGCDMVITYNRDERHGKALEIAKEMEKYGSKVLVYKLDILKRNDVISFFKIIKDMGKKLDIAINNAGVSTKNEFINLTEEEWDLNMDVNAKGVFFCCQEEAKIMIGQNYGKIINTASIASKIGAVNLAHYAASKYAVLGLTFTMAKELAKYNINVNAVCPGIILTDMTEREWTWDSKLKNIDRNELIEMTKERIPLKRFGTPEDVANMFLFLASEDSDYITSQAFNVDGGMISH